MDQYTANPLDDTVVPAPRWYTRVAAFLEWFFLKYRQQLRWVHMVMFVAFVAILFVPLALPEPPQDATPLTNLTTLANYLLWGVWFPLVFLSAIFTGRSWCGLACPMGAASEWSNATGPHLSVPRWMRWEGTPLVSFILTTILGQTLGVRNHPEAVAEIFGGTMLAAIVIGWLYGRHKRVWCRHLCPIGRVLGLYSRLGFVEFSAKDAPKGEENYTEKGGCPTMIDVRGKTQSRHCIECFRCVNPNSKDGIHLKLRMPGREIERIRDHHANPAEVWFLFLDTGVALGGFLWLVLPQYIEWRDKIGAWAIEHDWTWLLTIGPSWLMSVHPQRREVFYWLDFSLITLFMLGCMVVLSIVLSITTGLSAKLAGMTGADGDFSRRFTELGYQYAPVAMVSLVIGLGAVLFEPLRYTPLGEHGIGLGKGVLFLLGMTWSIILGYRILARQGVASRLRWLPLAPGLAGSVLVGLAWWPAIFGL